jgi:Zn-dependent protease
MPDETTQLIAFGFIWYIAFLFSTTCHEAAHALVAKLGGDETASLSGQVSLNPVPHIRREPLGMVGVPILTFILTKGTSMIGYASAPYDPYWERRHPKRSAWMALAGPATNFALMLLAVAGLRIGFSQHWFTTDMTGLSGFAEKTLEAFFRLNLLLGTFNLLPAPPLDGSTAIMLLMPERTAARYLDWLRGNSYAMLGLLVAWVVFSNYYHYVSEFAIRFFFR